MSARARTVGLGAAIACMAALACDGTTGGPVQRPRGPHGEVVDAARVDAVDGADASAAAIDAAPGDGAASLPALTAPPGSLDAVFAALRAAEAGAADGRVLISMFGDSHTASDALTGRMRAVLQARFGDAGRGIVAAGRPPYKHYGQGDVGYGSSGRWTVQLGGRRGDREPFGLMGFRVATDHKAEAWVETCAACPTGTRVARFDVLYLVQPGGAELEYRVDAARWHKLATAAARGDDPRPETLSIAVPDGEHRLTLRRGRKKGALDVFGIALERDHAGVVIDGLGVVGRRLGHLDQWDWSVIGPQLARRDPRLVVLQYGTNEADDPDLDLARVAAQYDRVLARIKQVVPGASVLVLGPPDMAVRAAGKACDQRGADPAVPECAWRTPAALTAVIEVERAAAARAGVAFFDTFAAMGGADHMDGWFVAEPKLAYGDHVHFTTAGYALWADALVAELLAAYAAAGGS